jgi:hypothetical protein
LARRKAAPEFRPIHLGAVRTVPLTQRHSKVHLGLLGVPHKPGSRFRDFWESLPDVLGAQQLREVARAIVTARRRNRPVILGLGAHPVKVGLNPILVDLMERGIITALAMNGAVIIHDFELAMVGHTSEEVETELDRGTFGMAEETGRFLNEAITKGASRGVGIGEAVGRWLLDHRARNLKRSLLAVAAKRTLPATVHVAVGTDIIHMHPTVNGAALGEGSLLDFRRLCSVVSKLEGGVYLNLGSAVILPEVFLKALTVARNLGHKVERFTTVNMDMLPHYRPLTNVVKRPTRKGGRGFNLIGHHEILFPLLAAGILEEMNRPR